MCNNLNYITELFVKQVKTMYYTNMENSGDKPPISRDTSVNYLERRAKELAQATRQRGMGMLAGKFSPAAIPQELVVPGIGWYDALGFIQGEETQTRRQVETLGDLIWTKIPDSRDPASIDSFKSNRQYLVANRYTPPVIKTVREVKKGWFKKEKVTDETPRTYNGKRGESNWIQFSYRMPVVHQDTRPGVAVEMLIAIPPDIGEQISEEIMNNSYFPDAFFQALYPGKVGPDSNKSITRQRATEIWMLDRRTNSQNAQWMISAYPEPIKY